MALPGGSRGAVLSLSAYMRCLLVAFGVRPFRFTYQSDITLLGNCQRRQPPGHTGPGRADPAQRGVRLKINEGNDVTVLALERKAALTRQAKIQPGNLQRKSGTVTHRGRRADTPVPTDTRLPISDSMRTAISQ